MVKKARAAGVQEQGGGKGSDGETGAGHDVSFVFRWPERAKTGRRQKAAS
jgi:hypothetical protein